MKVVIACAGRSSRFPADRPKHLQLIQGRPNLMRTIQLLRELELDDITVTVSPENHEHFRQLPVRLHVGSSQREIDRYRNMYPILGEHTLILYGDVVYQQSDLETLLKKKPGHNLYFGRLGGNPITRKQFGEIFGVVVVDPEGFRRDTDEVARQFQSGKIRRELGWEVYKQGLGKLHEPGVPDSDRFWSVSDSTDDFDTPEQYQLLSAHYQNQHPLGFAASNRGGWALSDSPRNQKVRVAVVGNAQSLFDQRWGSEIDQHDVVIRMNRAATLYEDHRGHMDTHGSRTDVWCMWRYREYENARVLEPNIRCQMAWWTEIPPDPAVFNINTYWFSEKVSPHTPTTGLMTLAWLSSMPVQVTVYGFDWKATPTFTDPTRKSEQNTIHNFHKERELCMDHFRGELGYEFR